MNVVRESQRSPAQWPDPWIDGLPLVPMEKFFLNHDHPAHPMVFRVLLRFSGPVESSLFAAAFAAALKRQPLLSSVVDRHDSSPCWRPVAALPGIQWRTGDAAAKELFRLPVAPIDVETNAGVRCIVCSTSTEGREELIVLAEFHHACCDGQGARQFLMDWVISYHHRVRGTTWKTLPLNADQLLERSHYRTLQRPVGTWEGFRNLYVTVRGRTAHLPASSLETSGTEHLLERVFSLEETVRFRAQLKLRGDRLNDLGLAAAFVTFSRSFPNQCRNRWLTVMHPVDLRWPSDKRTPACNRVGVTFLRRRPADCDDPRHLLESVRQEMRYIKERYLGAEFLRGLAALDRSPWLLDRIQRGGWFTPTLQFTYLGNTTRILPDEIVGPGGLVRIADLDLQHISGFMQRGPDVPISLAVCETHQRISVTARICGQTLDGFGAKQFFDRFVHQLLELGERSPNDR